MEGGAKVAPDSLNKGDLESAKKNNLWKKQLFSVVIMALLAVVAVCVAVGTAINGRETFKIGNPKAGRELEQQGKKISKANTGKQIGQWFGKKVRFTEHAALGGPQKMVVAAEKVGAGGNATKVASVKPGILRLGVANVRPLQFHEAAKAQTITGFNPARVIIKRSLVLPVETPTQLAMDEVVISGAVMPARKIRVVIGFHDPSTNMLTYDRQMKKVFARPSPQFRPASNITADYDPYADIITKIGSNQIWQYNPKTGSLCPDVDPDYCLAITDEKANEVKVVKWSSPTGIGNNLLKPKLGKKWVINMNAGYIVNTANNYALESGGRFSPGDKIGLSFTAINQPWCFVIVDTMN